MIAKINPENGDAAIVHDVTSIEDKSRIERAVQDETITFFRAHWRKGKYPTPTNMCGGSTSCTINNGMCMCEVTVKDRRGFKSMPTREQVLSMLHIGAYDPEALGKEYEEEKM